MSGLAIDFYSSRSKIIGGVQTNLDNYVNYIEKSMRVFDFNIICRLLGLGNLTPKNFGFFEFETSFMLERFLKFYTMLFEPEYIIKNSIIGGYSKLDSPTIVTLRDNNIRGPDRLFKGKHYSFPVYNKFRYGYTHLQRLACKYADKVIAVSSEVAEDYKEEFGIESEVINNAVNCEFWKPLHKKAELRKKYRVPNDDFVAVASTAFHPIKNFHIFPRLVRDFPKVHWMLILKHKNDYIPKMGNVTIFSSASRDEMRDLYNCADFAILPSLCECDNNSILQSFACGLPGVVTKVGRFANWWDEGLGVMVEDYTKYENFVEGVKRVIDNLNNFNPRKIAIEKMNITDWAVKWRKVLSGIKKK